jgi:RNA polymerase sigma-70 factor (ECF subfamily)
MDFLHSHRTINSWAEAVAQGDIKASDKLFKYFYPAIYRYIRSRLRSTETVEDLTQDVFLKVARNIKQFDQKRGHFTAWIWQIARNVLTDHFRAHGRRLEDAASARDLDLDTFSGDEEAPETGEEFKKIMTLITEYSEDDQELFRLRYVAEVSYEEMAEITGRSENALRVALHRIREKLKLDYDPQD